MFLIMCGLLITTFIALTLYTCFWPVGVAAAIIVTVIGVFHIYAIGCKKGSTAIDNIMYTTIGIGCVWLGVMIGAIIKWFGLPL